MKRILIISAGIDIGGLEIFAVNISRYAPEDEFSFDYLVFEGNTQDQALEITKRGNRILTVQSPHDDYLGYLKTLGKIIDENQYDVVHSHTQFNSGLNMIVAKKHHVPIRIAHSHTTAHEKKESIKRRVYESFMRFLITKCSTDLCACGVDAGRWEFGDKEFTVINNGIDTKRFQYSDASRKRIRQLYSIPEKTTLIGHCGAVAKVKNQEYIIKNLPPDTYFMCVGNSPSGYDKYLRDLSKKYGNADRVIIPGSVMNVEDYLSAFDVFAFPSLREGTPLALLEAQANGLPCIMSENVPHDVIATDLISIIPLEDNKGWMNALGTIKRNKSIDYPKLLYQKGFDVETAFAPLYDIYRR